MTNVLPETPPPANRGLWMLVIGLGIAILLVVAAMIGMAIKRAYSTPDESTAQPQIITKPGSASELNFDLEPGGSVTDAKMDGASLIVRISSPASDEILVIDPAKSKILSRLRFNKKAP